MAIAQINQVDAVLVARHDVWQLMEVFWEQWLQICGVRVVPWVLYLRRAGLGRPIYDKDA